MSLLQKLKNGFGARDHSEVEARPQQRTEPPTPAEMPRATAPREESPYAPRHASSGSSVDPMGRPSVREHSASPAPAAQARPLGDDDQLDIPAFLRRQAN